MSIVLDRGTGDVFLLSKTAERELKSMKIRRSVKWLTVVATCASLVMIALLVISCGGSSESEQQSSDSQKYPPGTTEEMLSETTGSGEPAVEEEGKNQEEEEGEAVTNTADSVAPGTSVEVAGARFTVVEATRPDSNADALTSGQREVPGDYLEIELLVENVGDDFLDLSEFSFRIWSTGIQADDYREYYGPDGLYGRYISENMISAVLLDYSTLQPVAYKLKVGESLDSVFLFYDLNPKSIYRNEEVTKEGTNLVFYKSRGEDAGEEAEINLAGYPD
jgi:hypothetical protein